MPPSKSTPDFTQAYVGKANALLLLKRAADAIECYHAALAITPNDAQIVSQLALALVADGKTDRSAGSRQSGRSISHQILRKSTTISP